jgi:hypothetical protein
MLPELTFGEHVTLPAFYGKNCVTGLGMRNSFFFRYEQPDLITTQGGDRAQPRKREGPVELLGQEGRLRVRLHGEAAGHPRQVPLRPRVAAPHSKYRVPRLAHPRPAQGHRCSVVKDDFQATWQDTEVVTADPTYRTNFGKIHYLQYLVRDHPLIMRPGHVYRLAVNFEPDVVREEG